MSAPTTPPATGGVSGPPEDASRTVELFVRSLSPSDDGGHAETVLGALDAAPAVDDHAVHVWGDAVSLDPPLADTDHARFVLDRVAAFREWAEGRDAELVGFETRETHCRFTDHDCRVLSLPAVVLAEYTDDGLRRVAPCRTDDGVVSVGDRVERLADRGAESETLVAD